MRSLRSESLASVPYRIEDLRFGTRISQARLVKNDHRGKQYDYLTHVKCPAGLFEEPVWYELVEQAIDRCGERDVQTHLRKWVADHICWLKTEADQRKYALECHSTRLFDDRAWVDFIPFNEEHRPEALAGIDTVEVVPPCCMRPGVITKERYDIDKGQGIVYCPTCQRWSNT